jgi:GDP-L-fucose synthase
MNKNSKIYVAGHLGMVGSAILRKLKKEGYTNIITPTRKELDLINQTDVNVFFKKNKPEYVFLAAAKVGGIKANSDNQADFIYENLIVEANVIKACHDYGVKKLLYLGSSCIYPRECKQPIKEEYLLSGPLEKTNEGYSIAKIAGIMMCQKYNYQYGTNYISLMPTNLYGPNDNYHLENSHVFPALIRKFHEAKERGDKKITLWGTGSPFREFLHVDDLADASIFLMNNYNDSEIVNVGSGKDLSIKELAMLMKKVIGFEGDIEFDSTKPDGTPKKLLDVSKINKLGWKYYIEIEDGLRDTYKDFLNGFREKG